MKLGRNDPCSCGSGKKFKHCCEGKVASLPQSLSPAEFNQLVALFNIGHHAELERIGRALLGKYPNSGIAWKFYGLSLQFQGKEALHAFQRTAELLPNDADALSNLGVVLKSLGQLDAAVTSYRQALKLKPDSAATHSNLGNALKDIGQLDEAASSYRQALKLKPDYAEAHNNLGVVLQALGQLDAAVASYRRAIEIKSDFAEAHYNLGNVLKELEQFDSAAESYLRAIHLKPDYAEAHSNLGTVLQALGQFDAAVTSYRQAIEIKPGLAEAHYNLGNVLKELEQFNDAAESYVRALYLKPDFADAYNNLGNVLKSLGQLDAAVSNYRRAIEIKPDLAEAYNSLGNALKDLGQLNDAMASYRQALKLQPDFAKVYSNLLFLLGYHALVDPHEYLAQARNWEQTCLSDHDRQSAQDRVFQRPPLPGRRLRVGYVSGDFRQHAVSHFVEQLFTHHDRSRVEVFAYSNHGMRDSVTERLQDLVEHWTPVMRMSDAVVRDRIESDGIDVLIDLSGHTALNRLGVFALRAAPVQVYYLGYFASTGLTEMDYWIGDEILTPAGTDSHFSEQVHRLPRVSWSYGGKDVPLRAWRPSQDGNVWLGSFNNLGKLTPATLALWAKVLHALPEGRLLIKTKELADAGNRQRILDAMSGHGILPSRIELQDSSATPDWSAHMAYYERLDIALDPVGAMGGVTTTCDTLWMAVPVIAMLGDRVVSRATASMLNAIGHPEWIARSETEYIDKVVALARDVEQRKTLRFGQRKQMALSQLCDAKGLTGALEDAFETMFNRWLEKH